MRSTVVASALLRLAARPRGGGMPHASLALLLLLQAGCLSLLFDDRCGAEYREVALAGVIPAAPGAGDAREGVAEVHLAEVRPDSQPRVVRAYLLSDAVPGVLFGHVTGARLLDAQGREQLAFAVTPGFGQEIARLTAVPYADAAAFEALRRLALSGGMRLELRTDRADVPVIVIALVVQRAGDWARPHCS